MTFESKWLSGQTVNDEYMIFPCIHITKSKLYWTLPSHLSECFIHVFIICGCLIFTFLSMWKGILHWISNLNWSPVSQITLQDERLHKEEFYWSSWWLLTLSFHTTNTLALFQVWLLDWVQLLNMFWFQIICLLSIIKVIHQQTTYRGQSNAHLFWKIPSS